MPTLALTGANGKTGRAIIGALRGEWQVRALARSGEQRSALVADGCDAVVGDIGDRATVDSLVGGADAVYHICPNFHPDEVAIAAVVADAAAGVDRFVYHSVLHPQARQMPHHWRKLLVEELLLSARPGRVTFLRPAPYVSNLAPYVEDARVSGELRMPYSVDTPTAMVDLADVGAAARAVLSPDVEAGSGWDLCGVAAVTHREIAARLSAMTGRSIEAVAVPPAESTPPDVRAMFDYMDRHGLPGSTGQLRALIGPPTELDQALRAMADAPAEVAR